ncbi:MAG: hypothetical protein ABI783_00655 [Actinomycetota bacterium]|jgi:hypothetical protein
MFLTSLPFDYAKLVDRGDRVRTTRKRSADSRLRRMSPRDEA